MIYQQLWNIDQENNGCNVATRAADNSWTSSQAEVKLDQQVQANGKRNIDLATRPLFAQVDDGVLTRDTYASFIRLLDNYIVNYRLEETETTEERAEIDRFIDAILATDVMKNALAYIQDELNRNIPDPSGELYKLWFKPFTNYYMGRSTHYCSGFEHVFVGEGKYNPRLGASETLGEISGYHSWIKFYLDEKNGRVNFLGYKYDLRGQVTPRNPNVVTLQMLWYHQDINGNIRAELFKKKGGFFVGTSPECEIAMGLVAYYESLAGRFVGDKRRTTINGAMYDLVLYRNITEAGNRGEYIRSFYPEFLGNDRVVEPPVDRVEVRPAPDNVPTINNGIVVITEALINPVGADDDGEWVIIRNRSQADVDINGWQLRDRMSRYQELTGILPAEQSSRIFVDRTQIDSLQLSNQGGAIQLYRDKELIASVNYQKARSGEIIRFE